MTIFRRGNGVAGGAPDPGDDAYKRKKIREAQRQRKQSAATREISPLPAVADPRRKARALDNFQRFCEIYFKARFCLAWSDDHLTILADFQRIIVDGGLSTLAMPRGSGKTSLAECAVLWAIFRGRHEFVGLIGATEAAARGLLESLAVELQTNELLAADFPEVCHPIRMLEGINQRRLLCEGKPVSVKFTKTSILLPNLPENPAASAYIKVAGLTGSIRGMKHTRPGGRVVRPRLVVIDDPQTDRSAKSQHQCDRREQLIAGAILGLAGPGQSMSCIMPVTVIVEGDTADRFLDRKKHPEWNGRRTKLLPDLPANLDLWDQYRDVRAEGLRADDGGKAGNAFYKKHRKAMDEGARAAWPQRHNADELSAVQSAMNLYLENRRAFFAEYQNDPKGAEEKQDDVITTEDVCKKLNGIDRGTVPVETEAFTASIDVHKAALYWLAAGWGRSFCGGVVDYGTFPDQHRDYFNLADVRDTIEKRYPKVGFEAALYSALTDLVRELATREWPRFGGGTFRLARILIDANWNTSTDVVYQFCRQSEFAAILMPSHGRGITAKNVPINQWQPKPGEVKGHHWVISRGDGSRAIRHITVDVNNWKSIVSARLATAMGDRGAFALYGQNQATHRLLAEHLTSELRVRTEGRGRKLDEWVLKPDRPDNHWLDCLVGSAVAASMEGVTLPEWAPAKAPRKKVAIPDHMRAA